MRRKSNMPRFARPIGRALIEAMRASAETSTLARFARPIGRALIEAHPVGGPRRPRPGVWTAKMAGPQGPRGLPPKNTGRTAAFARPIGRALIEAAVGRGFDPAHRQFARPIGRALIEAPRPSRASASVRSGLHGQLAVPSLKHARRLRGAAPRGAFARPIGRALIEAGPRSRRARPRPRVCTANWPCPH